MNGGIPETSTLLTAKWDKIFFTGSQTVGKIIAAKAAETLTPVTLELGGCNPAIVTESADPDMAARRLVFGKLLNAGQVCLSHNYTLVHRSLALKYIESLNRALSEMYPEGAIMSPDFGRIVNHRNLMRIKAMLDKSAGKILYGGNINEEQRFVEPTVVLVESLDDSLIREESFGPLMPIFQVDSTEEAITAANIVDNTPLAMSVFGNSEDVNQGMAFHLTAIIISARLMAHVVLSRVRSGGVTVNEFVNPLCIALQSLTKLVAHISMQVFQQCRWVEWDSQVWAPTVVGHLLTALRIGGLWLRLPRLGCRRLL